MLPVRALSCVELDGDAAAGEHAGARDLCPAVVLPYPVFCSEPKLGVFRVISHLHVASSPSSLPLPSPLPPSSLS